MVIDRFAAQFVPDGLGYRYRRAMHGPAVWVTAAERDGFVAEFARATDRLWRLMVAILVAVTVPIAAGLALSDLTDARGAAEASMAALFVATVVIYGWRAQRLAAAPAAALAGRPPIAPPLDRTAFRRAAIRAQPWSIIAIGPAGVALLWAGVGPRNDLFAGDRALWPLGAAAYLGFIAACAVRKWRIERADTGRL